jgi:hypothetical protein
MKEKIILEDFGFFTDSYQEEDTGVSGVVYICTDLLYKE